MKRLFPLLLMSSQLFAWGERGHHTICEVATRLVKEGALKTFLLPRGHLMGHVCNIPDTYWRELGKLAEPGNRGHLIDPERLDYTVSDVPLIFKEIAKAKSLTPDQVNQKMGSLWWRADQFYRLAEKAFKGSDVYEAMVALGLMGHFVGDASMPFHSTADYDGWEINHGGIHAYYETHVVDAMDLTLVDEVFKAASKMEKTKPGSVVERMKTLTVSCAPDRAVIIKEDKLIRPSERHGKKHAERPAPETKVAAYHDLIVAEMAKSAVLLAAFWDDAFAGGGKPNLSEYHSYKYPLKPDYVPPDYLE